MAVGLGMPSKRLLRGAFHDRVKSMTKMSVVFITCVLTVVGMGFAVPASAASRTPVLNVHVTAGDGAAGKDNDDGVQLPQEETPQSAGAGFVYELVELDAARVRNIQGTETQRTHVVLANWKKYEATGVSTIFGESDNQGLITEDGQAGVGHWMSGAEISGRHVIGGSPAVLNGTAEDPTYWYLKLVQQPAGVVIQNSAPGLVSLPYKGATMGEANWNVNVYPKIQTCLQNGADRSGIEPCQSGPQPVKPQPTAPVPSGQLARTGADTVSMVSATTIMTAMALVLMLFRRSMRFRIGLNHIGASSSKFRVRES